MSLHNPRESPNPSPDLSRKRSPISLITTSPLVIRDGNTGKSHVLVLLLLSSSSSSSLLWRVLFACCGVCCSCVVCVVRVVACCWWPSKMSLSVFLRAANFILSLSGGLLVELWPRFQAVAHPNWAFGPLQGRLVRASGKNAKFRAPTLRARTTWHPHFLVRALTLGLRRRSHALKSVDCPKKWIWPKMARSRWPKTVSASHCLGQLTSTMCLPLHTAIFLVHVLSQGSEISCRTCVAQTGSLLAGLGAGSPQCWGLD